MFYAITIVSHIAIHFLCPICAGLGDRSVDEESDDIHIGSEVIEEVEEFCYLGDLLDCEGGVERAGRMRVSAAWRKWREISSLLVNRSMPAVCRERVYDACIRSVMLYGSEGWPMTDRLRGVLMSCNRRMLRYIAAVSLAHCWTMWGV